MLALDEPPSPRPGGSRLAKAALGGRGRGIREGFGDGAGIKNFHSTGEMGNGLLNSVCGFPPWYAEAQHKITLAS